MHAKWLHSVQVGLYVSNFYERQQVHLRFAVFMFFCINYKIKKLFEISRLIAINFWWLID